MTEELMEYFKGDELAASVWEDKYCLKNEKGELMEKTPDDMHRRMAKELARMDEQTARQENPINKKDNYQSLSKFGQQIGYGYLSEDDIYEYLKDFKHIIPQGSIMAMLGNPYKVGSLSNCFVIPPPVDSYGGILLTDQELVQLMKRRGGVGTNLNRLRFIQSQVRNAAGSSTGTPSFASRYSNSTNEVAQDGRRGALMLLLICLHPDIFDWVRMKDDRTKVTGANVSTMLTNKFMEAAEADLDFMCQFPVDYELSKDEEEDGALNEWFVLGDYNKIWEFKKGVFFMKIHARELFDLIIEMAWKNGEPGLAFMDAIHNYSPDGVYEAFKAIAANPCVSGNTEILTENGYERIDSLVNKPTVIWNGFEWSTVTPKITGEDQEMLKIELSDGRSLECTRYHSWITKDGARKKAFNLQPNDKLQKYNFPIIKEGVTKDLKDAYTQGFISADGQDNYNHLWLYDTKLMCIPNLKGQITSTFSTKTDIKRHRFALEDKWELKSFVPFKWNLDAKINWLSGLLDGDGTELIDGGSQICSINYEFLQNVQKLLSTLGLNSKLLSDREACKKEFPNGKTYDCKKCHRICIGSTEIQKLKSLGLNCLRLKFNKTPNRSAQRFVYVKSITTIDNAKKVYCFNEPLNHSGIFNGIMTANCGEQWLQAYDSCRLLALNLLGIVTKPFTKDAHIDYDKLYEIAYIQQRLADDIVDLEIEHIERILTKIDADPEPEEVKHVERNLWTNILRTAKAGRRTGCGFTGLGDMLAMLNLKYDSPKGIATIEKVARTKMQAELDCTIDLAILRGTFEGFDTTKEAYGDEYGHLIYGNKFYETLHNEFPEQFERMSKFGRRNVSWSTIAPTGSLSVMAKAITYPNITGGMEPSFFPYYFRNRKIVPGAEGTRIDFIDQVGVSWQQYPVVMGAFKDWYDIVFYDKYQRPIEELNKDEIEYAFECSPWFGSTANDIDWTKRVEIQAVLQKYTTNAISSTINLPENVAKEEVANIYWTAWKAGLKGITVYRDKSRTGVLVNEAVNQEPKFSYKDAMKRPKELNADLHMVTVKGEKYGVIISTLDNNPYEVFAFHAPEEEIVETKGIVKKVKKGHYDFMSEEGRLRNLQDANIKPEEQVLTRLVSGMLRHSTDPKYIIEQINKCPVEIVGFGKAVSRVLKKYIQEGEESTTVCTNCGGNHVVYQEGCLLCRDCGHGKC